MKVNKNKENKENEENEDKKKDYFKSEVKKYFAELLTYPKVIRSFEYSDTENNEEFLDDELLNEESNDDLDISIENDFLEDLYHWVQKSNYTFTLYNFNGIVTSYIQKMHQIKPHTVYSTVAEYIQASILIFLNEVLYHNYIYSSSKFSGITFKQIKQSSHAYKNFKLNVSSLQKILNTQKEKDQLNLQVEGLDFYNYLIECPLWKLYILDTSDTSRFNKKYGGTVYNELNQYLLHGAKMTEDRLREFLKDEWLPNQEKITPKEACQRFEKEYREDKKYRLPSKAIVESICKKVLDNSTES